MRSMAYFPLAGAPLLATRALWDECGHGLGVPWPWLVQRMQSLVDATQRSVMMCFTLAGAPPPAMRAVLITVATACAHSVCPWRASRTRARRRWPGALMTMSTAHARNGHGMPRAHGRAAAYGVRRGVPARLSQCDVCFFTSGRSRQTPDALHLRRSSDRHPCLQAWFGANVAYVVLLPRLHVAQQQAC
jgi:hypothetical protein